MTTTASPAVPATTTPRMGHGTGTGSGPATRSGAGHSPAVETAKHSPARATPTAKAMSTSSVQTRRTCATLAPSSRSDRRSPARSGAAISPKTVSYHLYRAFPKLNVSSRTQLARLDLG